MKTLKTLNIGDKIDHYCSGEMVEGIVIERRGECIITKHKPVKWGNDIYETTVISPSLWLQMETSQTTPGAYINGKKLTL